MRAPLERRLAGGHIQLVEPFRRYFQTKWKTYRTGHLLERHEGNMGGVETAGPPSLLDEFVCFHELVFEEFDRVHLPGHPAGANCWPLSIGQDELFRLAFDRGGIVNVDKWISDGRVGRDDAWVTEIIDPGRLQLQQCFGTHVQEALQRANLSANVDAFHAEIHLLEVVCQSRLGLEVRG